MANRYDLSLMIADGHRMKRREAYGKTKQRKGNQKMKNIKSREKWIEENCFCGISEETGEWSEKVFDSFGCTCEPDTEQKPNWSNNNEQF